MLLSKIYQHYKKEEINVRPRCQWCSMVYMYAEAASSTPCLKKAPSRVSTRTCMLDWYIHTELVSFSSPPATCSSSRG